MKNAADRFNLERFVESQENVYEQALHELRDGRKETHWMWFIFPQMDGLGSSSTARHFSIKSLDEAKAYLAHPVLGPRLRECCKAILAVQDKSASEIFDFPDDLKLRSSMTLFAQARPEDPVFPCILEKYFDGEADSRTLELLGLS